MLGTLLVIGLFGTQPAISAAGHVPAALLQESGRDPFSLLMLLTAASVPAGLEVRSADATPRGGQPDFHFDREPLVSLPELVDVFNARHSEYRATIIDGVFVMRPADRTAAYLDSPTSIGKLKVTGVMMAGRRVFASLDPRLVAGGGILGSYINLDSAQAGEDLVISLDGQGRLVIDLLNQIASQSRRGWMVITTDDDRSPEVLKFGFMHRGGASTAVGITLDKSR